MPAVTQLCENIATAIAAAHTARPIAMFCPATGPFPPCGDEGGAVGGDAYGL
jgi:hypothetical protein